MATKPSPKKSREPKEALDAYGGDPLAPNDIMLERIAAVINDEAEKEDAASVERWADAFDAVCPEPVTPKRQFLAKLAGAVHGDEPDEEVKAWAEGQGAKQVKSEFNLDNLGS